MILVNAYSVAGFSAVFLIDACKVTGFHPTKAKTIQTLFSPKEVQNESKTRYPCSQSPSAKGLRPQSKKSEKSQKTHRSRNKNGLRCVYRHTVDEIYFDCGAFFDRKKA